MSSTEKYRNRLITLLKELFQLDKPELDFGLYKIMHAKSGQISRFLENDLLKEIQEAFGEAKESDTQALKIQAREQLVAALGETAIDETGKLTEAFSATPAGKHYVEAIQAAEAAKDTLNAEAEIYDHLYRFFERYYDNGDFMSRRYYARESDSRAAPYAVPYDGREVYLHWANKDQYYIKSSEYLSNYTFELSEAIRQESERQQQGKGEGLDIEGALGDKPHKVHFRIVEAAEGEHGNIKASSDQKRFFMIHDEPAIMENGELVIQFQYRADPEKSGQDKKWQEKRLEQAEERIVKAIEDTDGAESFLKGLQLPAPTDSQKKRTMLGKHLQKFSARNTMDYFIHKDLGGFLRRELDFYIKNEIMRLDDLENAEAPKVEQYLAKIRVLRRIAHQLIAFLAQLEDFQKKVWLKKKFVTETQYCITLDRVPEELYPEIVVNERQREEWVRLFAIDEIKNDTHHPDYSEPLTVAFLKNNRSLILDTGLYSEDFKSRLLEKIENIDSQCEGLLINSENYQAIKSLRGKYEGMISCIYIDPPYNTSGSEIIYKNSYKHSSWMSLMRDRVEASKSLISEDGVLEVAIDDAEFHRLSALLNDVYGENNHLANVAVLHNPKGREQNFVSDAHEYTLLYAKNRDRVSFNRLPLSGSEVSEKYPKSDSIGEYRELPLRRRGTAPFREDRPSMYFPFLHDEKDGSIELIPYGEYRNIYDGSKFDDEYLDELQEKYSNLGKKFLLPIREDGRLGRWRWGYNRCKTAAENNIFFVRGRSELTIYHKDYANETVLPKSLWFDVRYDASTKGTNILKNIIPDNQFNYPKSVFAVEDFITLGSSDDSVVMDFFAGSGTTAHSVINLIRKGQFDRRYVLVEMGSHFDDVLLPRIKKLVYSDSWKKGCAENRDSGISHCIKYFRLETYEDALNNLTLNEENLRDAVLDKNPAMQRDYIINYFLDVETLGSQSLLNIGDFSNPTAYKMWIKKPGSDEQFLKTIDLIETFNCLIGLWVEHFAAPQSFSAEFSRETDSDLPDDQTTRLRCTRLKQEADGNYWFRLVEGHTLRVPGDKSTQVSTLIIWRKLTDDPEKDNAALQKYLEIIGVSTRERTYEVIYVNGSHTLPNPVVEGEQTKVRLIEEAFHQAMWAEA